MFAAAACAAATRGGLSRRTLLRGLGAAALALAGSARALAAGPPATLAFHNLHTGESLAVSGWHNATDGATTLAAVSRVLRDHRNGQQHAIDPLLLDLLLDVAARCALPADFEVISGFRSPESNAALHARSSGVSARSLHMQGRAIDVRLKGCGIERLRDEGLALSRGGVGYYPQLRFVHLDTGRVRRWVG